MTAQITKRALLAAVGAAAGTRVLAQDLPPARAKVLLSTAAGPITLELANEKAPLSSANFLRYVDHKRLDGANFYRAMMSNPDPLAGLIQGGAGTDGSKLYPPIAHESTTATGLRHVDGTISLARLAPGTATCEFFICIGDQPYLDADPTQPGDNLGFAAFGRVIDGMDVARKILRSPTSPTEGEGVMKGQMLDPAIAILTARRL
jgi:peptidyl-prolyl cis-trans isomerase A (cyclophilin A)